MSFCWNGQMMLNQFSLFKRCISSTNCLYEAGDVYKTLWKCAMGGLKYNRRHRKQKFFEPIVVHNTKFGSEKIRYTGLDSMVNIKPKFQHHDVASQLMKPPEEPKSTKKTTFLTDLNLKYNLAGYSGDVIKGKVMGYPIEEPGDDEFKDYGSVLISLQRFFYKIKKSRTRKMMKAVVVVGNYNGVVGIGESVCTLPNDAIKNARDKAIHNLHNIPMADRHTVIHHTRAKYNNCYVTVTPCPRGYGIIAHRCIGSICKLAGIQDIHCRLNKRTRCYLSVARAFLRAVMAQETHEELADRKGCYVFESKQNSRRLKLLAMPTSKATLLSEYQRSNSFDSEYCEKMSYFQGLHEQKDIKIYNEVPFLPYKKSQVSYMKELLEEGH